MTGMKILVLCFIFALTTKGELLKKGEIQTFRSIITYVTFKWLTVTDSDWYLEKSNVSE